jgi:uncharacterized membrane protein YozB (DUF420 family)
VTRTAEPDRRPGAAPRWGTALIAFAIVGGPAAWVLHLLAGYGVEDAACSPAAAGTGFRHDDVQVIAILTVVLAAVALAAAAAGYVALRRPTGGDARGHRRFLAIAGLIGSSLFALIIVLVGYALTSLSGCTT